VTWIGGACWISWAGKKQLVTSLVRWGMIGAAWWCLLDLWEWVWIGAGVGGGQSLATLLSVTPQFWLAFCFSGWMASLAYLSSRPADANVPAVSTRMSPLLRVGLACGLYIIVYTTMNWRLYFNLLIPHGDSVMYEEHLWNVLHGKGFRSYLDQGLFFGEHIQFVHLFLLPLYAIWPSHLLLELLESTALALGAFPVYWMIQRQLASRQFAGAQRMALAGAIAYLLYTPMQYLDIEIDLKTFRPEAFGIPLLLLTLDQLERRNLRGFVIALLLTLTVKEDYAIVFGPLGLWIFVHAALTRKAKSTPDNSGWSWLVTGGTLCVGSVVYLWLATRVVMPWFRSGAEVHYARYFSKFGTTPEQIVSTMIAQPGLLTGELFSMTSFLYALAMLAPVALLPLFSPGRLAVGAPLFGILCLNELAKDPRHHFHAPLVAIVLWAVAGGLPNAIEFTRWTFARWRNPDPQVDLASIPRTLLWSSAVATGLFFSLSPLGISFWDTGSNWNWHRLYASNRRAELFARVSQSIPVSSRVASTDFVHPRFTHHVRSYDYSGYLRKVSDFQQRVPEDTDFIVIDTQHPYSTMKRPEDVPEFRDHSDQWQLLPDQTEGYFIVLKRRSKQNP
jgi:uncharacterized membrane protein